MLIYNTFVSAYIGESNLQKIQENVRSAIGEKMTVFCLGFGNDVDYSFLDVMARQNKGLARRIFEGSDAAIQLQVKRNIYLFTANVQAGLGMLICTSRHRVSLFQGFYEEVSSPLLLEVDLRYPNNAVVLLTKNHYSQLFNGAEIVVAGQLTDNDMDNFSVEVFAQGVRNGQQYIN